MAIDAKITLQRLRGEATDKERISLYITKNTYDSFKLACEEIPVSRVIEQLMKEFIESSKNVKNTKK